MSKHGHVFSQKAIAAAQARPENVRLVYIAVRDPHSNETVNMTTVMETKHSTELLTFLLGHGLMS